MFASARGVHWQNAYVTTDLDRAMEIWRDQFGVERFHVFDNDVPQVEASPRYLVRIALANVGGVEIELIEPFPGQAPLHEEGLPADGSFALHFHHLAMRIMGTRAEFDAHLAGLDPVLHPVAWRGELPGFMAYAYTDERATLGHYVEHVWYHSDHYAQIAAAIPRYPATTAQS